jgi:hypothetical protein
MQMTDVFSPKASAILEQVRTAFRELAGEVGVIEGAEAVAVLINYEAMSLGMPNTCERETPWGFIPPPCEN